MWQIQKELYGTHEMEMALLQRYCPFMASIAASDASKDA